MIISHKHKFIFIKTEKTAGTSVEIALSKICGPNDIITPISAKDEEARKELGYLGAQNYNVPFANYGKVDFLKILYRRQRINFYNHISANEIRKFIKPEIWDSYYKFAFERNPWDKMISWYYWKGGKERYPQLKDMLLSGKAGMIRAFDIYSEWGLPIVDDLFLFEELPQALSTISEKLKLEEPLALPQHKAKGGVRKDKRPYQEVISDEERDLIAKIFAREIAWGGYTFD